RGVGGSAREVVGSRHSPGTCAADYFRAMESFHAPAEDPLSALLGGLAASAPALDEAECRSLSKVIGRSPSAKTHLRQLFLDVTATRQTHLRPGVECVARAMTVAFLESPPDGFRVEPVYLSDEGGAWHYRYARSFALDLLNCPSDMLADGVAEPQAGDILLVLDNRGDTLTKAEAGGLLADLRAVGVLIVDVDA